MEHLYTNELIYETSPYLLQHAHNPVQWYAWGDTPLQKAKKEDKPILVSIGYAACHWCHVMERESFENREVADFMNKYFINIKIDREERPDLDHIYMDAVQAISGNGGWPLNVFLTTDAKPFFGGTYFPPRRAFNRSSWIEVLHYMKESWETRRDEVETQAETLLSHIQSSTDIFTKTTVIPGEKKEENITREFCREIAEGLLKNADKREGGFGNAPKFPQTFSIQYLLAYSHFFNDNNALQHATFSLKCMLRGGIYDHLAGGLARYSTDDQWLAPHFEKMLYDNALLVNVLCDAWQLTSEKVFQEAIDKTLQFCLNEMKHAEGGFYAALDADSDGIEGKFYVWNKEEIGNILNKDAALFCEWYGVVEEGNWEGKNILHSRIEKTDFANSKGISIEEFDKILKEGEKKLLAERSKRNRPLTDDKILLGWNALLLTAFCKAAGVLNNERYKMEAVSLFDFIKNKFSKNGDIVFHSYKNGLAKHPAYLDDYAYLVQALIALQELTGDEVYLIEAKKIVEYLIENFQQNDSGFFYYTHKDQADIIIRKIEIYDSAIPSGNSMMAENLAYLSRVFDKEEWEKQAKQMLQAIVPVLKKYPGSFAIWGFRFLKQASENIEVSITGKGALRLLQDVLQVYVPNRILQACDSERSLPLLKDKSYENQAKIYVCRNYTCREPVLTLKEFRDLLKNTVI